MANNMTRWDPFREMVSLRDAMDSLFQNALIGPFGGGQGYSGAGYLPLDLIEKEDSFVVKASVPGLNPEDLSVTVTDNVLTIQGEVKPEEQQEGTQYHLRERRWGQFTRQVALPVSVDANKVQAEYYDGVLMLTLPKSEQAKPKRIQIRTNGQKVLSGQGHSS